MASTSTTTASSTTTSTVPVPEPASVGLVEVGDAQYSLAFDCHAPGAGEILAVGLGTDPGSGDRIEVYLQAFLAEPYLGIRVEKPDATTLLYEAALDRPLEFVLENDVLRADGVELVTDLDLEARTGTPAGPGSIVIECREYLTDLPDGFSG